MHHNLDVHPIPKEVFYINDLTLVTELYSCMLVPDYEKVLSGKTKKEGGILPDDNVRIYVPMDLNPENIMQQLYSLYDMLGIPTEKNEHYYWSCVGKLIAQLEIYDQVSVVRDLEHAVQKIPNGPMHSPKAIELAQKMAKYMLDNDGCAELFPFEEIEKLQNDFWLEDMLN
jgi:hypothetical protein